MSGSTPQHRFERLTISNWRQFGLVDIYFHPRLTVLTGANASGKTTLLNILARHFSWAIQYLARPRMSADGLEWEVDDWPTDPLNQRKIGQLTYSNGKTVAMQVNASTSSARYDVLPGGQELVPGVFFPSHRPPGA